MGEVFRRWKTDEVWLLPPSVADFVPVGNKGLATLRAEIATNACFAKACSQRLATDGQ
jgi:hypothetical protein